MKIFSKDFINYFFFINSLRKIKLENQRRKLVFMVTIYIFIKYLLSKNGKDNIFQNPLEENGIRSATSSPKSLFLI
jgi:hypothetical protein